MKTRKERIIEVCRFIGIEDGIPALITMVDQECRLAIEGERERIFGSVIGYEKGDTLHIPLKNGTEAVWRIVEMNALLSPNPKAK